MPLVSCSFDNRFSPVLGVEKERKGVRKKGRKEGRKKERKGRGECM